ncbi:MAG TPA: cytochrome c, partial [Chthoniobacteraceae bacterium]
MSRAVHRHVRLSPRLCRLGAVVAAALIATAAIAEEPADLPGAKIYQHTCADCHGKNGEGVPDKYDEPLQGNRSIESLAKRISRTMPDDDPGTCTGDDAKQVAEYIYQAFYSPAAQARIRPEEIDLARLTVEQYRASVADVLGRFHSGDQSFGSEHGLHGHYTGFQIEKPPEVDPAPKPDQAPDAQAQPPKPKPKPEEKEKEKKDRPRVRMDRTDPHIS